MREMDFRQFSMLYEQKPHMWFLATYLLQSINGYSNINFFRL